MVGWMLGYDWLGDEILIDWMMRCYWLASWIWLVYFGLCSIRKHLGLISVPPLIFWSKRHFGSKFASNKILGAKDFEKSYWSKKNVIEKLGLHTKILGPK